MEHSMILNIDRSKKFNPATFDVNGMNTWLGPKEGDGLSGDEAQDKRSLVRTQLDWATACFKHCLEGSQFPFPITGEEKLDRLTKSGKILADSQIGEALFLDYHARREHSILERLRKKENIISLDFFGTIFRGLSGERYVLRLYYFSNEWYCCFDWLFESSKDVTHMSPVFKT